MIYAPVIITTLCRSKHFIECIESLKKNTWAAYTDVYIGVDYPLQESHKEGYGKICEYLEKNDFSVFKSFHVIRREKNYGSSQNINSLREECIYDQYDRWIQLEDDIVTSRVFLEYMDKCLEYFERDDSVLAVNGYSYPLNYYVSENATVFLQPFTCSTWGIGHWKRKYLFHRNRIRNGYLFNSFEAAKRNGVMKNMIRGRYYSYMLHALTNSRKLMKDMTDVAMGPYLALAGLTVVTPVLSKTRNMGFDGSGEYCRKITVFDGKTSLSFNYDNQVIDDCDSFEISLDYGHCLNENKQLLNEFLVTTSKTKIKVFLLRAFALFFGRNLCVKFWRSIEELRKNECKNGK